MMTQSAREIAFEVFTPEGQRQLEEPASAQTAQRIANTADLAAEADSWLDVQVVPLHNPSDPRWTLKREKPEHRLIIYLKCNGFTNREISNKTGYHICTVNNICKQPWARAIILAEITKAGRDQVETVLQGEALESVLKLVDIRDSEKAPVETQRKAANDLLDRIYGKPNQPVSHASVDPKTLSDAQLIEIARRGMDSTAASLPPSN